jgi:hypothetical protein
MAQSADQQNNQDYVIQNKTTVWLFVVAAVVLIIGIVGTRKAYQDMMEYRELANHEEEVLAQLEENRTNLENLSSEAGELASQGVLPEQIVQALPLRYHPAADLATLEQMALVSNAQPRELRINRDLNQQGTAGGAADTMDNVETYQANATVAGTYGDVKEFLTNLDISSRPMVADKVEFVSGSGAVSVEARLLLHYQDPGSLQTATEDGVNQIEEVGR